MTEKIIFVIVALFYIFGTVIIITDEYKKIQEEKACVVKINGNCMSSEEFDLYREKSMEAQKQLLDALKKLLEEPLSDENDNKGI